MYIAEGPLARFPSRSAAVSRTDAHDSVSRRCIEQRINAVAYLLSKQRRMLVS